ncbi:MAG: hypothetical protein V1820_05760, partial [archaeon]
VNELSKVFLNLTPEEFTQAEKWYSRLLPVEQERVYQTLEAINGTRFDIGEQNIIDTRKMAVIVAGSSIDKEDYHGNIDLFLLSETSLADGDGARPLPNIQIAEQLKEAPALPPFAYPLAEYPLAKVLGWEPPALLDPREKGLGAKVTIAVLYERSGFTERREGHQDDLLEPFEVLKEIQGVPELISYNFGAEGIIKYNRELGSKFLVLSRQYSLSGQN